MRKLILILISLFVLVYGIAYSENIKLPEPRLDGPVSVEKALKERRSIRTYKSEPLTLESISQLLWAAQGITDPQRGLRTAPSARAMYLIEVYVIPGTVTGIAQGMYKYMPAGHEIRLISSGNIKEKLYEVAGQNPIKAAPCVFLFTGHFKKSVNPEWVYLEVGHAAQNVYLQAVSLNLGTVVMAGFKPEEVKKALNIPNDELPVYIMPVGKK